jgi:4-amino-4-deoxy-L-arabinose transferase-like glycosyltransferase
MEKFVKILKDAKLVFNNPWVLIVSLWLLTRIYHFQNFKLFFATDSSDYILAAQQLNIGDENNINLNRSFLYVFVLKLFENNLSLLVFSQVLLSLFTALLMLKVLFSQLKRRSLAVTLTSLYLIFPMTAHFEGQILTENLSTFLLMLFFFFWSKWGKHPSGKAFLLAALIAVALVLHRPNYIVFVFIVVLISWLQCHKDKNANLRLIVIPVCISVLMGLNFITTNSIQIGGDLFRTGIAMHLVDTFASDKQNSEISREIDLSENKIKSENPSNRYWAVQDGFKQYLKLKKIEGDRGDILWEQTKNRLQEYPLLYLQSVNSSFFSVLVSDASAFQPGKTFRSLPSKVSILIGLLILGPTIFFGVWMYFFLLLFLVAKRDKKQLGSDLPFVLAIIGVSVVNAMVSPVEQGRYIFPFLPIALILLSRFILVFANLQKKSNVTNE